MSQDPDLSLESLLARGGHFVDPVTGAIVPPIHPTSTFARDNDYELVGDYTYNRYASPTVRHVEELAAELDGGVDALAFGSGLAGVAAIFETVATGEHIVAPQVAYHGTLDWLRRISERRGIGLSQFDASDPGALGRAVREDETSIVWIETPVNPTWDVVDVGAAADVAHAAGAILAVDATVAPPITMKSLELGADLVFHSATKYLNGHTDLGAGIVVTAAADDRWEDIARVRLLTGGVLGAFEAWLLLRGMRTLHLRYERASDNALAIARHLEDHPGVDAVLYPGLESHPGHDIAKRQMTNGFGGMVSLLVAGGREAARALTTGTRVFTRATSLGGVESLIEHRIVSEPEGTSVPDNLVRLSVGVENVADLIADLDQALAV